MTALGDVLLDAAQGAHSEVVLIAPFIKVAALSQVMKAIPDRVQQIKVVARWIPAEIAAGVCDIEIFDIIGKRAGSSLYVHPLLHAKMYRFDDQILFGSANLTGKALGWSAPTNLEILTASKDAFAALKEFESSLLRTSIRVDKTLRDRMAAEVALYADLPQLGVALAADLHEAMVTWLPSCTVPERIWYVYAGTETWRLIASAEEDAKADLFALGVPPGLTLEAFRKHVAAILVQMPLVQQIEEAAQNGLDTAGAVALIESIVKPEQDAYSGAQTWEILKSWLMYFLSDRYRTEVTSEVLRSGKKL